MEMRLTLDGEVLMDEIVQGLRGTALSAMFIGHNVYAAGVRQLRTIIEDMEVISNTGDANYMYYCINQGTRFRSSASIQKNFDSRMMQKLVMRSRFFGCVTRGCKQALERGCSMLHEEHGLTYAQLASLRVIYKVFLVKETARQRRTSTVRRLRDQIGQLVDATQKIEVSFGDLQGNYFPI